MKNTDAARVAVLYPGLVTAKFFETWDFYTEQLGFSTLEENDDRVLLVHPSGARLEIMRHETHEQFPELVGETNGCGFWLTVEVGDVNSEYRRLCAAGVQLVHPPENTAQGLHVVFTVRDPNGILIYVRGGFDPRNARLDWPVGSEFQFKTPVLD